MKRIIQWFKNLFIDAVARDPIILSIRANDAQDEDSRHEPFVFESNGEPYFRGSLAECISSRIEHAKVLAWHYQVPFVMTDIPEPYKSDLDDFLAQHGENFQ